MKIKVVFLLLAMGLTLGTSAQSAQSAQMPGEKEYQKAMHEWKSDKVHKYLEKAAQLGHPKAQFDMAKRYMKGIGEEQNYEKAAYWYEKA